MDIHTGRGNANKWMNRLFKHVKATVDLKLCSVDGGSLRNAIPRESTAVVAISNDQKTAFHEAVNQIIAQIEAEYSSIEKDAKWTISESGDLNRVVKDSDFERIINSVYAVHNGVYRMSPSIAGLVEASSSLAKVTVGDGQFTTQSLQRSSVESSKTDVANTIRAAFESVGVEVVQGGEYPGWEPNADSAILKVMAGLYRDKFPAEPNIKACHAGLECGILGEHFPGMDMISFGPNIRGAHSPDECVQISSVQKFWDYLLEVLKQIPA
jgi:dipeptidase D